MLQAFVKQGHSDIPDYLSHSSWESRLYENIQGPGLPTTNVPVGHNSLTSPGWSKGGETYKRLTLGQYQPATCLTSTDTALSTCLLVLLPLSSRCLPLLVLFLLQHSALRDNWPHAVLLPLLMFVAFFICGSY